MDWWCMWVGGWGMDRWVGGRERRCMSTAAPLHGMYGWDGGGGGQVGGGGCNVWVGGVDG